MRYGVRAARKRKGYPGNGLAFLIEKKTGAIAVLFFIRRLHPGYPENEMACLIEKRTAFHGGGIRLRFRVGRPDRVFPLQKSLWQRA
jgi:hypothetical protein